MSTRYCEYCGKDIDNAAIFCPHCGSNPIAYFQATVKPATATLNQKKFVA